MKYVKNLVDVLLRNVYTPYSYNDEELYHLVMALTSDAYKGKSFACDALAFVFFKYKGRLESRIVNEVAVVLGVDPDNEGKACRIGGTSKATKSEPVVVEDLIVKELLNRSKTLISLLNLYELGMISSEKLREEAAGVRGAFQPDKMGVFKRVAFFAADDDSERYYELMNNTYALHKLLHCLNNVTPGIPSSLPSKLIAKLAATPEIEYALTVPYLLFDTNDLYIFLSEAIENHDTQKAISGRSNASKTTA